MRFTVDGSWRRFGRVVVAGSPLRIFRLTARGVEVAAGIERGEDVADSRLVDRLLDGGAIHPRPTAPSRFTAGDVAIVTPQLGGVPVADGRLVVDDGSQPPLEGAALRLPINRGPAAARNAGRRLVDAALIAFVDADVTLPPDWLDGLVGHFDDERVGLVAPRVTGEAGSPLDLGGEPARIRAGTRVSYVPAAAIVVRVAALDDVGGFDETLRFGEDVDLVWRLDAAGWRCRYEPSTTVAHAPRATWTERMRQHARYGTSAAPLALRHPTALAPMVSNGWTASVWSLAALGRPVVAVSVAVGSSAALVRKLDDVPPTVAFGLAMRGHAGAARQIAHAIRREWWPIAVLLAVVSKRARWATVAAVLASPRTTPVDVAYGWGVWTGMLRQRTVAPILPCLLSWPGRSSEPRSPNYGRRS